jgi:formylglycine-generating enzyme required for sulfatase activity
VRASKARFNVIRLDVRSFPNERPAHRVRVDGFWIDEHDVTNAEFARFVAVTGYLTTAEKKQLARGSKEIMKQQVKRRP